MSHWKAKGPKPRVRFCWVCSRQLYGRQFAEVVLDGHKRIVHKSCKSGQPKGHEWSYEDADKFASVPARKP